MRKYIEDSGIKFEDTPQGMLSNDKREEIWKEQREIYGFDTRETWNLDYTIKLFLYERLCMYNEINCIDTTFHKIEYDGEIVNFQDALDKMIEGLKLDLILDEYDKKRKEPDTEKKINDVFPLLAEFIYCLWW